MMPVINTKDLVTRNYFQPRIMDSYGKHTLRKKEEEISKKALKCNPDGRRKPCRSKESLIAILQTEAKKSFKQMGYIAKERQNWKQFITTYYPMSQEGVMGFTTTA
jgi:hypothetical protein